MEQQALRLAEGDTVGFADVLELVRVLLEIAVTVHAWRQRSPTPA